MSLVAKSKAEAKRMIGVPYLRGGRASAGRDCPRDSDMQEAALGHTMVPDTVRTRIANAGDGPITRHARLDATPLGD